MILLHELCQVNPQLLDEKETRAQIPRRASLSNDIVLTS